MNSQQTDLRPHWLIVGMMATTLIIYVTICHVFGREVQQPIADADRELIRTIFYVITIIGFPLTNVIRHIQLRLNQTMPGSKSVKSRYLLTVIVSMLLMESVALLGFVMYMLGDDFNTLYIFIGLSALGLYLYRPKETEYLSVVEGLAGKKTFQSQQSH